MVPLTPRRPPVLADVARVAGVSVPTVSRTLTGAVPVSDKTRARVTQAIEQLGYRPNGAARALRQGRQALIAVLAGETTHFGYATTLEGIEEAARASGFLVSITVVDSDDPAIVSRSVDLALGQPVAGVIILEFDSRGTQALATMPEGIPLVAVSPNDFGRPVRRALLDDRQGGHDATDYLLRLGHRTVHHVAIPGPGGVTGRLSGWRRALEQAGAVVPEVIYADWTVESGYEAGRRLAMDSSVTAILCGNDEIAFGVIRAIQDAGRDVPADISVVGFDNQPLAQYWTPRLTTMAQDFSGLGRTAVGILVALMDGDAVQQDARFLASLVVRDSTSPPRA